MATAARFVEPTSVSAHGDERAMLPGFVQTLR